MSKVAYGNLGDAQLALRAAVAAGVAAAAAQALKLDFPIYALLAAIISTDLTPLGSRQFGLRRLIATLVGALCGALVSTVLPPTGWSAGLGILCTMLISQRLKVRSGAKVASYICAIMVLHFDQGAWGYAVDRFVETSLGVIIAWLMSFVPMLVRNEKVEADRRDQSVQGFRIDPEPLAPDPNVWIADVQLALRTATAATLAILVSQLMGLNYPIFAGIAAVVATDLSPAASRALGTSRIAATIVGAACGGLLSVLLAPNPWWAAAGVLVSMLACQPLKLSESAKIAACVSAIVMVIHGGQPVLFALERVLETVLGVIAAWAVSYIPKLIKLEEQGSGSSQAGSAHE